MEENTDEIEIKFQQLLDVWQSNQYNTFKKFYEIIDMLNGIQSQKKFHLCIKLTQMLLDSVEEKTGRSLPAEQMVNVLGILGFNNMKVNSNEKAIMCFDAIIEMRDVFSDDEFLIFSKLRGGMEWQKYHQKIMRWKAICLFEGKIDVELALKIFIQVWDESNRFDDLSRAGIKQIFKDYPELEKKYSEGLEHY